MVRTLRSESGPLLNLLEIHWQIACGNVRKRGIRENVDVRKQQ
jgi:hypothetical protein